MYDICDDYYYAADDEDFTVEHGGGDEDDSECDGDADRGGENSDMAVNTAHDGVDGGGDVA